jgi:hypothetical protein
MTKSATDVMQEIIFAAVIDSIGALKAASKGLPNTLLRDLNAVHANTTFADLPAELQSAISASVRAAFARLLKEGYSVSPAQPGAARSQPPRRDPAGQAPGARRPPPRRDATDQRRPPGKGGPRDRKPKPRG